MGAALSLLGPPRTENISNSRLRLSSMALIRTAGDTGLRWFLATEEAIASLANFPERCPLASEGRRLNQLLFESCGYFTVGAIIKFGQTGMVISFDCSVAPAGKSQDTRTV
jgi:hypothetical protein